MGGVVKSLHKSLVLNGFRASPQKSAVGVCGEIFCGVGKVWGGVGQKKMPPREGGGGYFARKGGAKVRHRL